MYLKLSGGEWGFCCCCQRLLRDFATLQVNQVRGLNDLSGVPTLVSLELLSLYGLPRVTAVSSLAQIANRPRLVIVAIPGLAAVIHVYSKVIGGILLIQINDDHQFTPQLKSFPFRD